MNHSRILPLALSAVFLLSLTGCGRNAAPETAQPDGVAVQVQTVALDTIATENTVSGQVAADNEAVIFLGSSAKCTAVYFQAGDQVNAGDIICSLDLSGTLASYNAASIGYQAAVQSYQDQSAVFAAQIQLSEKNVRDLKALFEIGAASQAEIDAAELQLQSAIATRNATLSQLQSGMESAKSGLDQLSTALEHVDSAGNVVSPISGTLASMTAVEGSFTSTSAPVAVIDGDGPMRITAAVAETLVPQLSIGDSVAVSAGAAGEIAGTIRAVDRTANPATQLYTVTVEIPAGTPGLFSGMFADLTFRTDVREQTVVVPTEAILTDGGTQYAFVVENGAARYTEVTTGLTGNGVTEVTSGLSAGESLVTAGQTYLEDGTAVRVVSGEA